MSKFTEMAATSHALSLAAMEEASRYGQRTTDIDHLLLALTVNEQTAGQVLRSLGITLAAARDAVTAQHNAQLASLGVEATMPEPGRIAFNETGGYEWSERSLQILKRSTERGRTGHDVAFARSSSPAARVLRELVTEPSGVIEDLLGRLGSSPEAVLERLDEAEGIPAHASRSTNDSLTGVSQAFVPAAMTDVWQLLADPARISEWDPWVGVVELDESAAPPAPGVCWTALAPTAGPDGKAVRIKPKWRRQRVELLALQPESVIAWRTTFPDADRANSRDVRIELSPAAGGTTLHITLAFVRHPGRPRSLPGRLLKPALGPFYRWTLWLQLSQIGGAIGRVFR